MSSLPLLRAEGMPGGVAHGFTTRSGGVSKGRYASLNLGARWGDNPDHVAENRRILLLELGFDRLATRTQVHGTHVAVIQQPDESAVAEPADAMVTDVPGVLLAVHVADCVPILFAAGDGRACGAAHAGWRGTLAGIAGEVVSTMGAALGCVPQDLRVALGPSIGSCCFEVGDDVADAFAAALPEAPEVVIRPPASKRRIALHAANRAWLLRAGVRAQHITTVAACTRCDPQERFFSFRRDGSGIGQQAGVIGIQAPPGATSL